MAWKIIDKTSGNVYVSKRGRTLDNLNDEAKALFESAHSKAGDLDRFEIVPSRTSLQERREYFKDKPNGFMAEVFPSTAEQVMQGNNKFPSGDWGKNKKFLSAVAGDVFSLGPRALAGAANTYHETEYIGEDNGESFNLGQRSGDEGGTAFGNLVRDPVTGLTYGLGGVLAKGIKYGADLGRYVIGKGGRAIGAAITGAIEGAGIEGASALMNDRELTPKGLALASGLGGAFEGAASGIQSLLQRFGKNYVKSAAQAARLGNTDREMTDAELIEFLSNKRNRDALETVLEKGSSGRNATPFVNDRGKALQPEVDKSYREAVSVLSDEPALNSGIGTKIENGVTPTEADMQRRMKALNSTPDEVDVYKDKTVWREGRQNMQDMAYSRDYPGEQLFAEPRRSQTKNTTYQSNSEYNLEKFADKYANIGSQFENAKVRPGEITRDESLLLDELERELLSASEISSKRMALEAFTRTLSPF